MKKLYFLVCIIFLFCSCSHRRLDNLNNYIDDLSSIDSNVDKLISEIPEICYDLEKDLKKIDPKYISSIESDHLTSNNYRDNYKLISGMLNKRKISVSESSKKSLDFYYLVENCSEVYNKLKDSNMAINKIVLSYYKKKRLTLGGGIYYKSDKEEKIKNELTRYYIQELTKRNPKLIEVIGQAHIREEIFNDFGEKIVRHFYDLDNKKLLNTKKIKICSSSSLDNLFYSYHQIPNFSLTKEDQQCVFHNNSMSRFIVALNNNTDGTLFTNRVIGGDIIFVYGKQKYKMNEVLKGDHIVYRGKYKYTTLLGFENIVDAFEKVNLDIPKNLYFLNEFLKKRSY